MISQYISSNHKAKVRQVQIFIRHRIERQAKKSYSLNQKLFLGKNLVFFGVLCDIFV